MMYSVCVSVCARGTYHKIRIKRERVRNITQK